MTSEQFAYWLNGFVELNGQTLPTLEQWKSITEHLTTVFVKVTPPVKVPTIAPSIFDEATRRFREAEQRQPSPYGPNFPYFGPVITC